MHNQESNLGGGGGGGVSGWQWGHMTPQASHSYANVNDLSKINHNYQAMD